MTRINRLYILLGSKRSGVFQSIGIAQTTTTPTMLSAHDMENLVQQYIHLVNKTSSNDKNTSKTAILSNEGNKNTPQLNLTQLETFSKPTKIPPIGEYLMTSSPTQTIPPIENHIDKLQSFGPIKDQLIGSEKISGIEDMPKIDDIESMDSIFKNEDLKVDFKRYLILARENRSTNVMDHYKRYKINIKTHKRLKKTFTIPQKRLVGGRRHFLNIISGKRRKKVPMLIAQDLPLNELKHQVQNRLLAKRKLPTSKPTKVLTSINIKRKTWEPSADTNTDEFFFIAGRDRGVNSTQMKEKIGRVMLANRKVFIPPPPPIEMKSLEPFKKEKEIEDMSKQSIQIENPQPIEGIDKHLVTIDKQPDITPIADHVIQHEDVKPIDDIEPIELQQ